MVEKPFSGITELQVPPKKMSLGTKFHPLPVQAKATGLITPSPVLTPHEQLLIGQIQTIISAQSSMKILLVASHHLDQEDHCLDHPRSTSNHVQASDSSDGD